MTSDKHQFCIYSNNPLCSELILKDITNQCSDLQSYIKIQHIYNIKEDKNQTYIVGKVLNDAVMKLIFDTIKQNNYGDKIIVELKQPILEMMVMGPNVISSKEHNYDKTTYVNLKNEYKDDLVVSDPYYNFNHKLKIFKTSDKAPITNQELDDQNWQIMNDDTYWIYNLIQIDYDNYKESCEKAISHAKNISKKHDNIILTDIEIVYGMWIF